MKGFVVFVVALIAVGVPVCMSSTTLPSLYDRVEARMAGLADHITLADLQLFMQDVSLHWPSFALAVAATLVALYVYSWLTSPLDHHLRLEEVGYIPGRRQEAKDVCDETIRRRRRGDLPPPFPNGWYRLADSAELQPGDVKPVNALGQHFAVFRGESGEVHVLDAYCPHLGANLAIGGKVCGERIACPFHGWEFDGNSGKCTHIPYSAGAVPDFAKTRQWHSMECNGFILVWFDAEGREPLWRPKQNPGIQNGSWKCRGKTVHYINAHIQEVPENAADVAHLTWVHSPFITSGTDLRYTRSKTGSPIHSIIQHMWSANWKPGEGENSHIGILDLTHHVQLFGRIISSLDFRVQAHQVGPALVFLNWECSLGRGAFIQSLTPIAPLVQEMTHQVWTEWQIPTFIGKLMLRSEAMQVERDIMIWNNKAFNAKPLLVKEDQLIGKFRRWYAQFYSASSRDVAASHSLDW